MDVSRRCLVSKLAVISLCCCSSVFAQTDPGAPNVLLILADDLGIETLGSFGVGDGTAETPVLNELAARGVSFSNVWSQPLCSSTRATILTGRYGFRTGVGAQIVNGPALGAIPAPPAKPATAVLELPIGGGMAAIEALRAILPTTWGPSLEEFTLPMALATRTDAVYSTAAIGKWHMADVSNGWQRHPNLAGFAHFSGLLTGAPESYSAWVKVVDGEFFSQDGYAPADKVDDTIDWIREQQMPWFVWLGLNLVHVPIHLPPQELLTGDYAGLERSSLRRQRLRYFSAMIEAMDAEIGRLLDSIDEQVLANTHTIFMGDNGTRGSVVGAPFDLAHAKATLYQGGINVPLIVSGPGVAQGGTSEALVNSTDLFASILDLAGVQMSAALSDDRSLDSVSIVPYLSNPAHDSLRDWVYADHFPGADVGDGGAAIRDRRFKLIEQFGIEELYDLVEDPYERDELLVGGDLSDLAASHYRALRNRLNDLHSSGK